jgi:hypothetical protein
MPLVPHQPQAAADEHAALVVALDAGDLAGADLARAVQLRATCGGCAALAADLGAIREAMTALPVPARRRDYRLSPEDAARLRPSGWRRFRDWLAAPGSTVRPLATSLATLGIVGLLVTAGLPGLGGFGAGGATLSTAGSPLENGQPADVQADGAGTAAPAFASPAGPAAAASPVPGVAPAPGGSPVPEATDRSIMAGSGASPGPTDERTGGVAGAEPSGGAKTAAPERAPQASADSGMPAGVVLSLALLLAGAGLFAARLLARRRPA